jgi:hypothetical protein
MRAQSMQSANAIAGTKASVLAFSGLYVRGTLAKCALEWHGDAIAAPEALDIGAAAVTAPLILSVDAHGFVDAIFSSIHPHGGRSCPPLVSVFTRRSLLLLFVFLSLHGDFLVCLSCPVLYVCICMSV